MKFYFLRKKYPHFIYRQYSYKVTGENLKISFLFETPPDIQFRPEIVIKNIPKTIPIPRTVLHNFIFHLGLMEIPSYWKTTCSPEIIIEDSYLNQRQIQWWKNLIFKGMSQFFYENKINYRAPNFLKIKVGGRKIKNHQSQKSAIAEIYDQYLVPMGGGRNSIVTLEKLKKEGKNINCFVVNPTSTVKNVLRVGDIKKPIIVERKIDPKLLELNKKGYLNGHTPFTAVLSFLCLFCAILFGYKNIAFSNEKSADEGNVRYLGKIVNHQWSKSSEFERKFKNYFKKYLVKDINYFSYLRPYTELGISKMFTRYPRYFSIFSSCNVAVAEELKKRWCGKCPKCLFVYTTLYPFLEKKQLIKIFGEDLFQKKELLPVMQALIDWQKPKPFQCVGTYKESRLAFQLSLKKARKSGKIPYFLKKFNEIR